MKKTQRALPKRQKIKKQGSGKDNPVLETRWIQFRIGILIMLLIGIFGAVLYNMYSLQVTGGEELKEKSDAQANSRIKLDSHRGAILDRNGRELAVSIEVPSIFVHPKHLKKPLETARVLSQILNIPLSKVEAKVRSKRGFVWIARKVSIEQGALIKALKHQGVGIEVESKRYYPNQELAGPILGFVGLDNDGLSGLELAFNKKLKGGSVTIHGLRDSRGRMLMTLERPSLNTLEGNTLVTTIDQYIQRTAENALERAVTKYEAKEGMVIVMDVHSGEVLAMASWPRFNPNRFRDHEPKDWRNGPFQDAYEPGSIVKPLLYTAALHAGVVRPDTPFDSADGTITVSGHKIKDSHIVHNMTAEKMVVESSNRGAYLVAKRLGPEGWYSALRAFGFGEITGVGLSGESSGIMRSFEKWYELDFANIAFGQGLSVTPMQVAVALSAIGNGGEIRKPLLIKEIRDREGNTLESFTSPIKRTIFSPEAFAHARRAMAKVVSEGTGMQAWIEHYPVGGKTGTAEQIDPVTRRYNGRHWMANFIGLAPIDDPKLAIVVMIREPKGRAFGGVVSAPVFAEISKYTLPYLKIYPKEVYAGNSLKIPKIYSDETGGDESKKVGAEANKKAGKDPSKLATTPEPSDESAAVMAAEAAAEALIANQVEAPGPDETRVPDLRGLALRGAILSTQKAGLTLDVRENGYVIDQWPSAGTLVQRDSAVQITLKRRYRHTLVNLEP